MLCQHKTGRFVAKMIKIEFTHQFLWQNLVLTGRKTGILLRKWEKLILLTMFFKKKMVSDFKKSLKQNKK